MAEVHVVDHQAVSPLHSARTTQAVATYSTMKCFKTIGKVQWPLHDERDHEIVVTTPGQIHRNRALAQERT